MKTHQLFASALLALSLCVNCCIPSAAVYAANVSDESVTTHTREDMVAELTEKGIPEAYLANKPDSVIDGMYRKLEYATVLSFDTQPGTAYEVNNENQAQPLGEIAASKLDFTVTTLAVKDASIEGPDTQITRVMVMVDYQWSDGYPNYCYNDSITVNWDHETFNYSPESFSSQDWYTRLDTGTEVNYFESTTGDPLHIALGGLGYNNYMGEVKLLHPGALGYFYGFASFDLIPAHSPIYMANASTSTDNSAVSASYAHSTSLFDGSVSFEIIDDIVVTFDTDGPSYDYQTASSLIYYISD